MKKLKSVVGSVSEHESVSVRKIENGYIVSHTCMDKDGYKSREVFTQEKPKVDIGGSEKGGRKAPRSVSSLGKAMRSI